MDREDPGRSHRFGRIVEAAPEAAPAAAPAREPFSRAPWPALALAASILATFLLQSATGSIDGWNERFGLRPDALADGSGWAALFTALWSHANWAHAGANAMFCLAFGAPVSKRIGTDAKGAGLFLLFYLLGGALASLGFAAAHRGDDVVLVGASGAVSALTGAAARLLYAPAREGDGATRPLAPFLSSPVLTMTIVFVAANLALGLVGVDLGQGDAPLAWEAHLAGYAAGLLLIGPFVRLADRGRTPPE